METNRPLKKKNIKMADLDYHQSMLKQKSEFERDLFRKQMLYGVDLIDDN